MTQGNPDMKFDLKTILGILTVAATVLAGVAGVVWFVVGLAIAPLNERLIALKDDTVAQGERTDRRFSEQAASLTSLTESVVDLRESVDEIKGGLLPLMSSKWEGLSMNHPSTEGSLDGQAAQSPESLGRNS